MVNKKIINNYNNICNEYFTYDKISKYKINFNTNNNIKYLILDNNIWCLYKIICIETKKDILWNNDMMLIEKELLSKIKSTNNKNIDEYILENIPKGCIGIIKSTKNNTNIYYEINRIIKT